MYINLNHCELLTLPEHLSSPSVFSGLVILDLLLYVYALYSLFVLFSFFFWPLCCMFFFDLRFLITPLVSFDHCVVCSSSIYGFWLPLWYLHTFLTFLLPMREKENPSYRSTSASAKLPVTLKIIVHVRWNPKSVEISPNLPCIISGLNVANEIT